MPSPFYPANVVLFQLHRGIVSHMQALAIPSGVARGVLMGLEHPLSQKGKKNRIGIFQKNKIIGNIYYLSVILNTKIGTYIRISVYKQIQVLC